MENASDIQLEKQIKELRHEVEKLSALLALRKLESNHPSFHKLVSEITRLESAARTAGSEAADLGGRIVNHIAHCPYRQVAGHIALIGTIGYVIYLGIEWLLDQRKS